jgi:hypothetical protein
MNPLQSGMRPTSRNIQLQWTQRRSATLHIFVCLSHLATAEELLKSCKMQLHQRWWTPYWESENRSRETASHEQEHEYSRVGAGNKTISESPTSFDQIKHKNSDQNRKQNNQLHINKNLPTRYTQSCWSRRNNRNRGAACITSSEGEEAVGTSDRRRASGRRRARERSRLGRRMKKGEEICPVQDSCGRSRYLPAYQPTYLSFYQVGRQGRIFTGCCNWVLHKS